jgi:hypothetical protein
MPFDEFGDGNGLLVTDALHDVVGAGEDAALEVLGDVP